EPALRRRDDARMGRAPAQARSSRNEPRHLRGRCLVCAGDRSCTFHRGRVAGGVRGVGESGMNRALQAMAWLFLALDTAAVLVFWSLTASSREGESAYAIAFLLVATLFVGVGGGVLLFSRRRGSSLGLGCAAFVLGLPVAIVLAIWISNLL